MRKYAYIIISLWLSIISIFIIKQEYTFQTGKEVLLKTIPVDPRDLLRGDYVILNYEIAQIPKRKSYKYNANEIVYVSLITNNENIATIKKISKTPPKHGLYLKGRVGTCPSIIPLIGFNQCISYGIESYFVKEGTGLKIERELEKGAMVIVAIDKNGNAKVKGFARKIE